MQIILYIIIAVLVLIDFLLALGNSKVSEKNKYLNGTLEKTSSELIEERKKASELNSLVSSLETDNKNLKQKLTEQAEELLIKFENLSNKILEEKSEKFTIQNKENLDQILKPLNEKIKEFENKVQNIYVSDSKERAGLIQQIKNLHELNQQMSKDANNLTKALKGDTKTQGTWGEFILESVLEKSGLSKGREYQVQESVRSENGKLQRPDVVVYLPEEKNIIIDSKISLSAYEKCVSSEVDEERNLFLKDHIRSIKNHIKGLSEKSYQNLYKIGSPDFVLMFVSIEPAFALAVQNDSNIFYEAFEKNIIIVSPSTLLATLRTIANIWKQENQNKNALEIAHQSGALYDKFVGFIEDLIKLGNKMDDAKTSYEDSMKKLTTGTGNLVRRVEKIRELGAKASKSLPESILDRADDDSLNLFNK